MIGAPPTKSESISKTGLCFSVVLDFVESGYSIKIGFSRNIINIRLRLQEHYRYTAIKGKLALKAVL